MFESRFIFVPALLALALTTTIPAEEAVRTGQGEAVAVAVIAPRFSHEEPEFRHGSLPFTAADAIHYFSAALDMSWEKLPNGGAVFENPHDPQPEDRWRIEVLAEEKNLIVEFTVRGNVGMAQVREFFESPLFERDEYEPFYAMLSEAANDPVKKMRRFTVKMTMRDVKETQVVTLKFSPRDDAATAERLRP